MIGYQMLYAVAVGLPILLAALVASAFLRKHGRAERGGWVAALILALALPVIALTEPAPDASQLSVPAVESRQVRLPAVVAAPGLIRVTVPVARSGDGLDAILIGLWVLASTLLAVRWAVAATRLGRVIRSCPTATVDGMRATLTSDLGPAVAGWIRPRILVPSWLMSLPPRQRSLVLLHEEEHVRAKDPLLIVCSRVARILSPWNPFVWLLSSRLLRAVELDCDRRVLRRHPDVEAYGTTLLTVSSRDPGALVGAAAFSEAEAPLRRRILAMTTPRGTVSVLSLVTALVLGMVLLLGVFGVPIPAAHDSGPGQEATSETLASLQEQLRRLEERQARTTRPAAAAEALLDEVARARIERAEIPSYGPTGGPGSSRAATSGTITGTVTDVVTHQPINHVQIFLRGTGIGSLTDGGGRFLLFDVQAGEHEVVAQRIGFEERAMTVTVAEGAIVPVELALRETAVALEGLLITGEPPDPPDGPLDVVSRRDGAAPLVFIDGVRATGSRPIDLDDLIRPEEIDRVEVIKGAAAVRLYGEEAQAGAVLIYRKREPQENAEPIRSRVPGGPTFTPFTVAPSVLNVDELKTAMREAYPSELRDQGVGGTVHVYFFITEDGDVRDARIHRSSGHQALDDAALSVARVYRFSPALNRDERVAVWVAFPITFVPGR